MDLGLKGKTVLITGATKGIGKASKDLFLEEGAIVIAVARDISTLEQSERLIPFAIDVSKLEEIENLHKLVSTRFPEIHVLINNVGTNIRKPTHDYKQSDFEDMINVNIRSAWELCRKFQPALAKTKGNIVNVSSVASQRSIKTSTLVYAMTKSALNQMTQFLASEWGPLGIRVNAVLPWYIATPLVESVLSDPEKLKPILEKTPLKRVGQPSEVADLIAYLASERASYVSGALVPVDGAFLTN